MCSKQKSLTFGQYIPNDKVLNKKVPENPKYKHVKPAIDTGKTVRKHIDDLKEKLKNCNYKKDEVFKRIKFSYFIRLVLAVASDLINNETCSVKSENTSETPESHKAQMNQRGLANVLVGIGELDLINEKNKNVSSAMKPKKQMSYLLLDARDKDAYAQCHIVTAKSYPAAMLSRSVGYETEDMKLFKNYPLNIIIIYDEDETVASRVATTLVQRGYDNVFLLSGGLKLALEICPSGLTTSSQRIPHVHMFAPGTSSEPKPAPKELFTAEDIDILQSYIDGYPIRGCQPSSSSQLSQYSRTNSATASSNRTHSTIADARSISSRASSISSRPSSCNSTNTEHHLPSNRISIPTTNSIRSASLRNSEHIKPQNVVRDRPRSLKKAPWK